MSLSHTYPPYFSFIIGMIKEGDKSFIMENNTPECIAANVIRALEHLDQEGIALRARALVEREFIFERAVEGWCEILGCR